MVRKRRIYYQDDFYHVNMRGNAGQDMFFDKNTHLSSLTPDMLRFCAWGYKRLISNGNINCLISGLNKITLFDNGKVVAHFGKERMETGSYLCFSSVNDPMRTLPSLSFRSIEAD